MRMPLRFKMIHILIVLTIVGCLCARFLPALSRRHAVITAIANVDGVSIGKCNRARFWSDIIGIRSFDEVDGLVFVDDSVSTDLLAGLRDLTGLTTIAFFSVEMKDDDMRAIGQLTSLRHLYLCGCNVSDADLIHLKSLDHLETLDLSGTDITDSGLLVLEKMRALREISLYPTSGHRGLRRPRVSRTQIDELQRRRADLAVRWDHP